MKLTYKDIEPFLKKPNPAARAILVYGPDSGLVQERAAILCRQIVPDINDPFNTAHLDNDIIKQDGSRLTDEANAQSLMGGPRLLRITSAANEVAIPLKAWLKDDPNPLCTIVIEAGDLKPKDALRKVCEDSAAAAALPCYVEDERSIATLIKEVLRENGYGIQSDAVAWFAMAIKGDRMRARMEIEKLVLYMGGTNGSGTVLLDDVRNSSGEAGTQSIDDLIYAFGGGDVQTALKSLNKLSDEGVATITILRSLQNHVLRLHGVLSLLETQGQSVDVAMKSLSPPVFFKQADQFKAQLRRYSLPKLRQLLYALNQLEAKSKQTGTPIETMIGNFLVKSSG